ncbi:MAG: type II toxin-antitoxin system ParD family antitoxin [Planctomycetes bacterium]|nr:type II toxin-antitoxin system ParD family antitoxin [Planctomycetota bacterium]
MNVRLTAQQEELLRRLVSEGHYLSVGEALQAGLRLIEQDLAWKADARRKLEEGLEDVRACRVVDGEQAIQEILDDLDRRERREPA